MNPGRIGVRTGMATAMRGVVAALALGAWAGAVPAHETPDPKHGGMVVTARHLDFELVVSDGSIALHVEDHGEAVSTAGSTATLVASVGGVTRTVEMFPDHPNRLVASNIARPDPGVLVTVHLTLHERRRIDLVFKRP